MLPLGEGPKAVYNGEECTISQRVLIQENELLKDIFKKIVMGYKMILTRESSPLKELILTETEQEISKPRSRLQ